MEMAEEITTSISVIKHDMSSSLAMFQTFDEFIRRGHRGGLRASREKDGSTKWEIEINGDNGLEITAELGQVIVEVGGMIQTMSCDEFDSRFPTS
jgi:hypothetical protein